LHFAELFRKHTFVFILGLVAPLTVFTVFAGYPILYNFFLSFTRWNGLSPNIQPVGLHNYIELSRDPRFILSLVNTLKWTILSLLISLGLGLLLSIVLFLGKVYLPSLFRLLIFVPVTMSLVATGIMFSLILSPEFGLLDQSLRLLHLTGLSHFWLGD